MTQFTADEDHQGYHGFDHPRTHDYPVRPAHGGSSSFSAAKEASGGPTSQRSRADGAVNWEPCRTMWLCRSARHVRGPLRRRSRRHEQMQPAAPRGSCTRRADGDRPGAHMAASRRELRAAWLIYGKACHEAYMSGSQLHCRGPLIWGTVPGWRSCWRALFLDCSVRLISAGWLPRDDYSAGACRCLGLSVKGLTVCSQLGLELAPSCCHVAAGTGPGGHFFVRHVHSLPLHVFAVL